MQILNITNPVFLISMSVGLELLLFGGIFASEPEPETGLPEKAEAGVFDPAAVDKVNPVPECLKAIRENRLFADALSVLEPWTLDPAVDAESLPQGVNLAVDALTELGRIEQIDSYLEGVIAAHPQDGALLLMCAQCYELLPHYGYRTGETIVRSASNCEYSLEQKDWVRSLQLYRRAEPILRQYWNDQKWDAGELSKYYQEFAACFQTGSDWRLQILTDLETLPDPMEQEFYDDSQIGAPVDAEGNPIFYSVPESFEAAANDGGRWRYLLHQAVEVCPEEAPAVNRRLAEWLRGQFGVQTLSRYRFFIPEKNTDDAGDSDSRSAVWSLETLADNETIARLAGGVKRFTLPDDQNYLKYFQSVFENGSAVERYEAAVQLGNEYNNRRQYDKAAEYFKAALADEAARPETNRPAAEGYRQIVGNWGEFEPIESKGAGMPVSIPFKFRNAESVDITVWPVDVPLLLADITDFLLRADTKDFRQIGRQELDPEQIGWRLMNEEETKRKYLREKVEFRTVALNPAAGHKMKRIEIPLNITDAGAYLIQAQVKDGNADALCLWLNDLALAEKPLADNKLFYLADALTGAPVPDAEIQGFGYAFVEKKGIFKRTSRNVETDTISDKTDSDGFCLFEGAAKEKLLNSDWSWLITAAAPGKDGGHTRTAYLGFNSCWHSRRFDGHTAEVQAYFISDRPIYKPGDTAEYKFYIGKPEYDAPEEWVWGNRPVQLIINSPDGTEIANEKITLDETGSYSGRFKFEDDFRLGRYNFQLKAADNDNYWIGSGTIRLEEYRKPEYEVTIAPPADPVQLGEKFQAKIEAKYFFGSPVAKAKVHYTVTRTKKESRFYPVRPWDWFYGNGYGWLMPDADWYPGWSRWGVPAPFPRWRPMRPNIPEVVAENEVEIGPDGTVSVEIDSSLAAALYPGQDQEYEITAEVTDQSRRTETGSGTAIAASCPFRIYCWTEQGFAEPSQQVKASIQARRADGKAVSGKAAVKLYRISYPIREDGTRQPVETEISRWDKEVPESGIAEWSFTAGETGQYRLAAEMTDAAGHTVEGGAILSVRGTGPAPAEAFQNGPVELVPEKAEYRAGETVRLSVNGPENGTVILFPRSRNGQCGFPQTVHLDGTQSTVELPLEEGDMPNIFVEAMTISGGRFYETIREIPVVPEKRVIDVEVLPSQAEYKPGEKGTVKIRLTDSQGNPVAGDIAAAVYDRSVEAVAGGSNVPEIKGFFWNWKRFSRPDHRDNLEKTAFPIQWDGKKIMNPLGLFDEAEAGEPEEENDGISAGAVPMSNGMSSARMSGINAAPMMGAVPGGAAKQRGMMKSAVMEDSAVECCVAAPAAEEPASTASGAAGSEAVIRENFADTAFWAARLTADENGEAEIALDMPENLTAWKIRVWSFAPGTRVGEGTAEVITRKDFILRMQKPRFLTQTDTAVLSANLHNYHDAEKNVTVSLNAYDPETGEETPILAVPADLQTQKAVIPAGGEVRIDWPVKAPGLGNVRLVMKAVTDDDSDAAAEIMPVQIHGILKQEAFSGVIDPNAPAIAEGAETADKEISENPKTAESAFTFTIPAERLPDQTKLTVRFSPTLAGSMIDALPYLADYPYGCTEQTLNRFLPAVLTRQALARMGIDLESLKQPHANLNAQQLGSGTERLEKRFEKNPIYDPDEIDKMAADGLKRLSEMQCSDGGWGWFSGWGESSSPYLTALVTKGLLLARQTGIKAENSMIQAGVNWLENYLHAETLKLLNGETWTDDQKEKNPDQWKSTADSLDVLVYYVLHQAGFFPSQKRQNENEDADKRTSENLARMKEYIWRDRVRHSLYTNALYAMALFDEDPQANAGRIALIMQMMRQYLTVDGENQTAYLDLKKASNGFWCWWSWDGNAIETQTAFLRLLVRTDPNGELAPKLVKYLLNNRKNGTYWNSTRDTALCIEAFTEYLEQTGEGKQEMTVEILADGERQKIAAVTPDNLLTLDNTLELSRLSDGEHTVTIRRIGDGPLYWNAYVQNFTLENFIEKTGQEVKIDRRFWLLTEDEDAQTDTVSSQGTAVQQKIKRWNRTPIENAGSLKSGDLVEVELTVTSKNDYDFLLIEDRKGAGYEPVEQLSGYNGNELGAYVEYRDDRVSFFVKRLDRGTHRLTYRLRAETPGEFSALPAAVLGMYAPELAGNSDEIKTNITDREE